MSKLLTRDGKLEGVVRRTLTLELRFAILARVRGSLVEGFLKVLDIVLLRDLRGSVL